MVLTDQAENGIVEDIKAQDLVNRRQSHKLTDLQVHFKSQHTQMMSLQAVSIVYNQSVYCLQ